MDDKENKLILYKDDEGNVSVNVRFADEDVWLTREHLAEIYATTPQNISLHVGNIYADGELEDRATRKKFFLVRQEGSRNVKREIDHYNLDMIIALGYRVQSQVAVRFRRWATQRLHEYIQKGFAMDEQLEKAYKDAKIITIWEKITKSNHEDVTYYKGLLKAYTEELLSWMEIDFVEDVCK